MSTVASGFSRKISRLESIDLLRGVVMVLMALDHTRDYTHGLSMRMDLTDLTQTTPLLFLTRWFTHFCAPVFVFLAGTSAYLVKARGRSTGELSRFLLSRGLWLIVLEVTWIRTATWFTLDLRFLGILQVIWVIGVSMIVLAGLVHLPAKAIAVFGFGMIALHNAFDGVRVAGWQGPGTPLPGGWEQVWIYLHQTSEPLPFLGFGPLIIVIYPLVPWIGVMAAGYVFGVVYTRPAGERRRMLVRFGVACIAGFLLLRAPNLYGDAAHWRPQPDAVRSALSFVNTTKYPPSLLYLLMTLGPAFLALAWLDGRQFTGGAGRAFVTLGRVPMFFYLLQWPLAHGLGVALTLAAGKDAGYLFRYPPEFYTTAPPDAGFSIGVTYACWLLVVTILFVLCRWYAGVKARRRDWWLSYL